MLLLVVAATLAATPSCCVPAPHDAPVRLHAAARPDTTVPAWVEPMSGAAGSVVVVPLRVDLSRAGRPLGAVQARLRFDPSLLVLQEVVRGDFQGLFQANAARASEGLVVLAGASPDTALNRGVVTVAELAFRLVGSAGARATIHLEVVELVAAGDFRDLTGLMEVREGSVSIR